MIFKEHFKKKTYWTVMCPECKCSIDIYKPPEKLHTIKCQTCGRVYDLDNPGNSRCINKLTSL
jgi:rubredoxin